MKTEKMLKVANELNRCIAYSDTTCFAQFYRYKDDSIAVWFTHIDSRYRHNNKTIFIGDWLDDERTTNLVDKVKRVIAGEELIND